MDINENQVKGIQRAYWMSSLGIACLGSKQKTGSKPQNSLECDTITEGLRTAVMFRDFLEKGNMKHSEDFPEKGVS